MFIFRYYYEGIKYEYDEINAIRNYFGERRAFYFAWLSFYTSQLIFPAIMGGGVTIYQLATSTIESSLYSPLFAVLMMFWVTWIIERWKRKNAEIALKWGIFDVTNSDMREIRSEYYGDEFISRITGQVDKHANKYVRYAVFAISFPTLLFMMGCCVVVFAGTVWYKTVSENFISQTAAGMINGISITVMNFLYNFLAEWFVDMENHKYTDEYESSLVIKSFTFKFLNSNIGLFYTAFVEKDITGLFYLLLGIHIVKAGNAFAINFIMP